MVAWLRQSEGIDLGAAAVAAASSLWQSSAQGSRQMKRGWQGWLVPPVCLLSERVARMSKVT